MFIFCARRGGRGESKASGGVVDLNWKSQGGGGRFLQEGGGGGAEGPCLRKIGEFGGGGEIYCCRGRNVHQDNHINNRYDSYEHVYVMAGTSSRKLL